MSVTRFTRGTISSSVSPDWSTSSDPSSTLLTESWISPLISLAAVARALGQVAHLGGDHGEAAALLAGPRRLDGGVERQQVGLEGDLVDGRDDVGDLLATRR